MSKSHHQLDLITFQKQTTKFD